MKSINKVIIFGAYGFLGRSFWEFYKQNNVSVLATHHKATLHAKKFNLLDPIIENLNINNNEYNYAILTAGITKISTCENNKNHSYTCNVKGILKLAKLLSRQNIKPIIFSSDYVFDGNSGNYKENSPTTPLNEYGKQKAELEEKIPAITNNNYLIIRPGKIFGDQPKDNTLITEMVDALINKKKIKAAHDQVFNPIYINDLIYNIMELQKNNYVGIFNVCGKESITRLELANLIAKNLSICSSQIEDISLDDLPENFRRPKNTSLDCTSLQSSINMQYTPLESCIKTILQNLGASAII